MPQGTTENVTVAFREMVFTGIDRGTMARRTSVALPHARRFTFDGSRRRISAHGLVDAKHLPYTHPGRSLGTSTGTQRNSMEIRGELRQNLYQ